MLASAAACFSRPKARISGVGMRSPPILKFWNERWVCAPHSLSAGTSIGPKESLSLRVVFCLAMEGPRWRMEWRGSSRKSPAFEAAD